MSTRTAIALTFIVAAFALVGCGFSPVYGKYANGGASSPVSQALDSVYIATIPDRSGQKLRNLLLDRFYKTGNKNAANAQYRLVVSSVDEVIYGLGIAKDAAATRSQIKQTAYFTLTRSGDPESTPLIERNITAISSFNTLASQYTTLVTEEDARDQTINDLANQITTMLEMYFANPSAYPVKKAEGEQETPDEQPRHLINKSGEAMSDPYRDIGNYE